MCRKNDKGAKMKDLFKGLKMLFFKHFVVITNNGFVIGNSKPQDYASLIYMKRMLKNDYL